MKAAIKKITLLVACLLSLTGCKWNTETIRHIFFEYRFNLESTYGEWLVDTPDPDDPTSTITKKLAGSFDSYFDVPKKTTYIDMHVPAQTDNDMAPRFGNFEFQFATLQPEVDTILTGGQYYGLANPHAAKGLFYYTFDDTYGIPFISERTTPDSSDTRKNDPNYEDILSRTFCCILVDYFRITVSLHDFRRTDGYLADVTMTFRSERWGG